MKIYLDDVRHPPDETWTLARTVNAAIELIKSQSGRVAHISFDYDMGMTCTLPHDVGWQPFACDHTNGHQLIVWMQVYGAKTDRVTVHTANPEGRKRLLASAPLIAIDPVAACIPAAGDIHITHREVGRVYRAE